jgi:hypothetical protein
MAVPDVSTTPAIASEGAGSSGGRDELAPFAQAQQRQSARRQLSASVILFIQDLSHKRKGAAGAASFLRST